MRDIASSGLGSVFAAMGGHLPPGPVPGPGAPGPESLADPDRIREVLTDAGLTDVAPAPVEATQVWGRDATDAGEFLGGWGPVRVVLDPGDAGLAARAR